MAYIDPPLVIPGGVVTARHINNLGESLAFLFASWSAIRNDTGYPTSYVFYTTLTDGDDLHFPTPAYALPARDEPTTGVNLSTSSVYAQYSAINAVTNRLNPYPEGFYLYSAPWARTPSRHPGLGVYRWGRPVEVVPNDSTDPYYAPTYPGATIGGSHARIYKRNTQSSVYGGADNLRTSTLRGNLTELEFGRVFAKPDAYPADGLFAASLETQIVSFDDSRTGTDAAIQVELRVRPVTGTGAGAAESTSTARSFAYGGHIGGRADGLTNLGGLWYVATRSRAGGEDVSVYGSDGTFLRHENTPAGLTTIQAIASDGTRLYATDSNEEMHSWLPTGDATSVPAAIFDGVDIAGATSIRGLTHDGEFLYATSTPSRIITLNPSTGAEVRRFPVPSQAGINFLVYDAAADELLMPNAAGTGVVRVNKTTGAYLGVYTTRTLNNASIGIRGAAFDEAGNLWVANNGDDRFETARNVYYGQQPTLAAQGVGQHILHANAITLPSDAQGVRVSLIVTGADGYAFANETALDVRLFSLNAAWGESPENPTRAPQFTNVKRTLGNVARLQQGTGYEAGWPGGYYGMLLWACRAVSLGTWSEAAKTGNVGTSVLVGGDSVKAGATRVQLFNTQSGSFSNRCDSRYRGWEEILRPTEDAPFATLSSEEWRWMAQTVKNAYAVGKAAGRIT